MSRPSIVQYYCPQDETHSPTLNAFCLNKRNDQITYQDIQQAFPLSGHYLFRLKQQVNGQVVWLSLDPLSKAAITNQDRPIVLKALRVDSVSAP